VGDIYLIPANLFHNDDAVKWAYTRPMGPNTGADYDAWGGDWGTYPGIRFMFGQLEGIVNPYSLSTPTPTPSASPSVSISVDSSFSGYTTAPIEDGVISTTSGGSAVTWASVEDTTPHWIELSFSSPQTLNTATINWAFSVPQNTFMTSQSVQVQYWNGSSYQTLATMTRTGDVPSTTVIFPTTSISKLRFYQPSNQGNPLRPGLFWVTEVDYSQAATPSPSPTPTPTPGPTACSLYTPSSTIPTGYASPYDVVSSPSTNLMNVTCDISSARVDLGKGDPLQYIYNQGYLFKTGGTNWTPVPYTSTEQLIANAWYPKTAAANIALTSTELTNPSYSLAYICS
jgi:hypothetical protein